MENSICLGKIQNSVIRLVRYSCFIKIKLINYIGNVYFYMFYSYTCFIDSKSTKLCMIFIFFHIIPLYCRMIYVLTSWREVTLLPKLKLDWKFTFLLNAFNQFLVLLLYDLYNFTVLLALLKFLYIFFRILKCFLLLNHNFCILNCCYYLIIICLYV